VTVPYLAHFGLKEHPFTLTPNIDFYYPTQETANIAASLDFALRRDSGIVKVVGEVGTGKTLLCRLLMHKLEGTERVAYINAPQADTGTILRNVCEEFGVDPGSGEGAPFAALNRFLLDTHAEGKLAVVVVDEAQHLGREGLEAIRLISNLETERRKLLQIVLFGQTELDALLADPSLRQLNQRVVFSFNTRPLTIEEAKRYIAHRIKVSRQEGVVYDIYAGAALDIIARRSGGIPRIVNILADKSLVVAFSEGSPIVEKAHALAAIRDTANLVPPTAAWLQPPVWRAAAAGAAIVALAAAGAYAVMRPHVLAAPESAAAAAPAPVAASEPAPPPAPPPAPAPTPAPAAPVPGPSPAPASGPAPAPVPPPAGVSAPAPAPVPPPAPAPSPPASLSPGRIGPVE
jgi:type II secretory pathway predicted ATPase ExeA